MWYHIEGIIVSAISASEARKRLFPLIEQVNNDHTPVEIVHRGGNAVLVEGGLGRTRGDRLPAPVTGQCGLAC